MLQRRSFPNIADAKCLFEHYVSKNAATADWRCVAAMPTNMIEVVWLLFILFIHFFFSHKKIFTRRKTAVVGLAARCYHFSVISKLICISRIILANCEKKKWFSNSEHPTHAILLFRIETNFKYHQSEILSIYCKSVPSNWNALSTENGKQHWLFSRFDWCCWRLWICSLSLACLCEWMVNIECERCGRNARLTRCLWCCVLNHRAINIHMHLYIFIHLLCYIDMRIHT